MEIQKIYGILHSINMIIFFTNNNENFKNKKPKEILKIIRDKYENKVTNSKIIGDYSILAYKLSKFGSEWNYKDKIKFCMIFLNKYIIY